MDIEKLARGIPDENSVDYWIMYWNDPMQGKSQREKELRRREARRAVFHIIKCKVFNRELTDVKCIAYDKIISPQLDSNLAIRYLTFTHEWDIHPVDWTKIIRKMNWGKEGGKWDPEIGVHAPTAFTKQEFK